MPWRPRSGGRRRSCIFLVPDIAAAHRALTERGVHFQGEPHLIYEDEEMGTEEWMAFFDDPDGNTLALMARVERPVAE